MASSGVRLGRRRERLLQEREGVLVTWGAAAAAGAGAVLTGRSVTGSSNGAHRSYSASSSSSRHRAVQPQQPATWAITAAAASSSWSAAVAME